MTDDRLLEPEPTMCGSEARRPQARRLQTGVRAMIALVACCGILFWAARNLWESQHPGIAAARRLRATTAAARVEAIRELVNLGAGDSGVAIPPLIAALGDPETPVRISAAEALSIFGTEAAKSGVDEHQVRAALAALRGSLTDREPAVRGAAASALGLIASCCRTMAIDPGPTVAALVDMLDEKDTEVHRQVVGALGFVGPAVLVDPPQAIVAALDDESVQNRAAAVDCLANFTRGLPRLIPTLIRSMEKAGPETRAGYSRLLGQVRPPKFSPEAVFPFIMALESHDPEIRYLAVSQLATFKRGAQKAVPALIKTLSVGTHRIAVMMALSEFGPKAGIAIPRLRALQKDPDRQVRRFATDVLQRLEK